MKKIILLFVVVLLLALPFLIPSMIVWAKGLSQDSAPFMLTAWQVGVVGLVSSGLVTVFRFMYEYANKKKFVVPELAMQIIVLVVAGVLGYEFYPQSMPPLPNLTGDAPAMANALMEYLNQMTAFLLAMFAAAHFIYKIVMERVKQELRANFTPFLYQSR